MKSGLFTLNWKDVARSFVTAVLTAFTSQIYMSIAAGTLPTLPQLKAAGIFGLCAGFAYLIKNYFTDDTKAAVKTIEKQGGTVKDVEGQTVTSKLTTIAPDH